MRQFVDIKIAIAIVLDREAADDTLLRLSKFYQEVSSCFHPESFCFYYYDNDALRCRNTLLKASALEDYYQSFTYMLWVRGGENVSLSSLRQMVVSAETQEAGKVVVSPHKAILVEGAALKDYICNHKEDSWFKAPDDQLQPEEAFCLNLKNMGYQARYLSLEDDGYGYVKPFKVSSGVQYLPDLHKKAVNTMTVHNEMALIAKTSAIISACLDNKAIAIYGAGTVATSLMPLIRERVSFVVDKNLAAKDFLGFTVGHPESLKNRSGDIDSILITPIGREGEIRKYLQTLLGDDYNGKTIIGFDGHVDLSGANVKRISSNISTDSTAVSDGFSLAQYKYPASDVKKTRQRSITKRGVLYVGYLCNIRCVFCYYAYTPAKDWYTIEECKKDARLYREVFGNDRVDITGGEPTVYPHIFELLNYCAEIRLIPTLITNMQALAKREKALKFKEHGVYDFLCSIHALGQTYDDLTKVKGSWRNVLTALENLHAIGMKWRANCTMTAVNRHQLKTIAELVYNAGGRVINYINYNPFYEWSTKMDIDFQSRHSEMAPYLKDALDYCDSVGLEANVRYLPFCMMKGHEDKCYNYPQLSYDSHEWDYCSWFCQDTRNLAYHVSDNIRSYIPSEGEFHLYMANKVKRDGFCQSERCMFCAAGSICDGFASQYANRFGTDEMQPYSGEIITDPAWYIRNQDKVVDE
ncbi:MAG: radical SAM protein [Nitrospirae bacterium]|nr:radical SAM protein [Nitrospirota bacterium]